MGTDPLTQAATARGEMRDSFRRISAVVRIMLVGFAVTIGLLLAVLGGVVTISFDTNQVVKDRHVLEDRNAQLVAENAELDDLLRQSTDAIVLLLGVLETNGIDAPEIVIRPTTTTVPE